MRKLILIGLFASFLLSVQAQKQITNYEYWFDNAYNEKMEASANNSGSFLLNTSLNTTNLTKGLHTFHIRFRDNESAWSSVTSSMFYKLPASLSNTAIKAYRYWADNNFSERIVSEFDPVNPLIITDRLVFIDAANPCTPNDYTFDPDPFTGFKVTYNTTNLFNIQFQDEAGQWSSTSVDTIQYPYSYSVICDTLISGLPKVKSIPTSDTLHFFMVNALEGDSLVFKTSKPLILDLFDPYGKKLKTITSQQSTTEQGIHAKLDGAYFAVVHGFASVSGSYSIEYTHIAKYALLGYTPQIVGNRGFSLLEFSGNGFSQSTTVRLFNADTIIEAHNISYYNLGLLKANISFEKAPTGFYNVEVNYGDTIIVVPNGIEVELFKPIEFDIQVIGPAQFRVGTPTCYSIQIKNKGNVTAFGVPLGIVIGYVTEGGIMKINIVNNSSFNKIPPIDFSKYSDETADSLRNYFENLPDEDRFFKFYDSLEQSYSLRNDIYIANIAPNSTYTLSMTITASCAISIHAAVPQTWNYISSDTLKNTKYQPIIDNCCIMRGLECIVNLVFMYPQIRNIMNTMPIDETCVLEGILNFVMLTSGVYCEGTPPENANLEAGCDLLGAVSSSLLGCIDASNFNVLEKLLKGLDFTSDIIALWECSTVTYELITGKCDDDYTGDSLRPQPVTSFDPNDKYGYRSPSGSTFFNSDRNNFTYIINFENQSTATAPAQEIVVIDTLDANYLDLNSFKAGFIKIGNKIAEAPFDAQNHTWQVDMRPTLDLRTQVQLTFEKNKGIARWHLITIDPKTDTIPLDPLVGFLPPNDSTGSGQGSVSFSIDLNDNIANGAIVKNRASIIFDYNDPILTPTWSNKKDMIAPASSMFPAIESSDTTIVLSWQGSDNIGGAGVYCYNLYAKKGEAEFVQSLSRTTQNSANFVYEKGVEYAFYVTAIDSAENKEIKTHIPDITFNKPFAINDLSATKYGFIHVYPNPSQSTTGFVLELSISDELIKKSSIQITSVYGSLIKSITTMNKKMMINDIPAGIYLVSLFVGELEIENKKIVVGF